MRSMSSRRPARLISARRTSASVPTAGAGRGACALDAPKTGMRVEAQPSATRDHRAGRAHRARGQLDVGGIEYLVDDRDGEHYFYDINALSNFVADAEQRDRLRSRSCGSWITSNVRPVASARRAHAARPPRACCGPLRAPDMRYGYWMPVFGGWLRNVEDEGMEASWDYVKRLAQRSEEIGYDLTLIAELFLNDIKGIDAPSLDAWSTAAALAAVTDGSS